MSIKFNPNIKIFFLSDFVILLFDNCLNTVTFIQEILTEKTRHSVLNYFRKTFPEKRFTRFSARLFNFHFSMESINLTLILSEFPYYLSNTYETWQFKKQISQKIINFQEMGKMENKIQKVSKL